MDYPKTLLTAAILLVAAFHVSGQDDPIAAGKEKFLGCVYSSPQVRDFQHYWDQVTPENAGKWGSVESTRDTYNWSALDAAYEFARTNDFPFRFHVLIWGNQQPAWIEGLSTDEQLLEIEEWMDTVAARYPDVDYLEVVNEPINDPPAGAGDGNYIDALGGAGETGYDWIITAFQMARECFPDAQLVINEYNIVNSSVRAGEYRKIVGLLQEQNLIDVIGVQAHAFSTSGSASSMTAILDNLAETGLPLMATEFDIDGPTDTQQLEDYQRIFPVFWTHPSVIGVTLWGFRSGMWRTEQKAYLINSDGTPRPAMTWLRGYVETDGALGLDDAEVFSIYPNPVTNGNFRISGLENIESVNILGMDGKLVKTLDGIDVSAAKLVQPGLDPGIYIFQIHAHAGVETFCRRVVVR